ncbi:LPS export ABC transporter permease LptF [Gilvimarinus agarilyticus]|uniref:LPS export ABC transporter permease LptF n=1 Tax=unclassified Gilvimarinus TaxID=2642066 RepID=UPI001C08543C|nr:MULTISPECIES: LPS export ABC transporter permease LptF [unclassified Gilvimarinus]MBU2887331.1 LPS export ABC transporter permease LptF [Gilvimarinus agarilyticus]MDO6571990.1 LPS export ABC transporter permease LptF [Gilvimarinus sp. 2_MG-2023]MDO6746058.1 LPS export ABC transporter permease LptF [Gilvimarinus sp. 1_MG-2023]
MIIYRYLAREILLTMVAVSGTLLLIIMSGRFVKYLAEAATGKLAVDVLFSIMFYRLPGFLELVIPLGFLIAILLAYGRMYMDSEMVVLSACGMSPAKLLKLTMLPTVLVALFVGSMSLWVSPWGAAKTELLFAEQRSRNEFTMLRPGHFQSIGDNSFAYVQSVSNDREKLNNLFLAQLAPDGPTIAVAQSGNQFFHPQYNQRFLELHHGVRYQGVPGSAAFQVTEFERLGQFVPEPEVTAAQTNEADSKTTLSLLSATDAPSQVALQWRLSMPIMVLVVALIAVPLSRTNPRQGRFLKMLPAIILYLVYVASLSSLRSSIEEGGFPLWPGLWLVHGVFLLLALIIFIGPSNILSRFKRGAA